MMFIDLFINNMNIYENDAYFQPITEAASLTWNKEIKIME